MLGRPSTVLAHFSRDMLKALGRTLHSEVSVPECWQDLPCEPPCRTGWQLGSWHSLELSGTQSLSPCLAAAPGSQGFVSAFPFLPAGLALQSGSQEQEQGLVYRCKGWRKPHPLLALTTFGEINTPTVLLRQFRELNYFFKIYFHTQGTGF